MAAALAALPDPRRARRQRHRLAAVLALAGVALLCHCDGLRCIVRWGAALEAASAEHGDLEAVLAT